LRHERAAAVKVERLRKDDEREENGDHGEAEAK